MTRAWITSHTWRDSVHKKHSTYTGTCTSKNKPYLCSAREVSLVPQHSAVVIPTDININKRLKRKIISVLRGVIESPQWGKTIEERAWSRLSPILQKTQMNFLARPTLTGSWSNNRGFVFNQNLPVHLVKSEKQTTVAKKSEQHDFKEPFRC